MGLERRGLSQRRRLGLQRHRLLTQLRVVVLAAPAVAPAVVGPSHRALPCALQPQLLARGPSRSRRTRQGAAELMVRIPDEAEGEARGPPQQQQVQAVHRHLRSSSTTGAMRG